AWLGAVHLLLMSLAVMATGNHYLLDIVAGLAVVSVALGIDWVLFHRRNGSVVQMMTSPRTVAYGTAR
ncbi:MAG: phosphatase PAP2 family protein, partial [Thermomicrobiales bacterium]|nr:phosphatase PAP2 family protein [Thermomicrobiales bacterium]